MRPQLNPALRRAWRDPRTVQIGVDPARAVVIGGLDAGCARFVDSLDGTADAETVLARAGRWGLDAARAGELLDVLAAAGVVTDAERHSPSRLEAAELRRFAPDLSSATLAHGDGIRVLERRRRASVTVHGLGRVGTPLAVLLGCAGVGRVAPEDAARLGPADLSAVGPDPADVGRRREDAVRDLLARVAPATRVGGSRVPGGDHLVAVCGPAGRGALLDELTRAGVPHLVVDVRETTGIVGPFVIPGRTACSRCQHLHRTDRDPHWPRIHAQLVSAPGVTPPVEPPCDAALAAAVAAQAALHALLWIDTGGATLPPSADGTVELLLPDARVRRRSWPPHPACGCGWPRAG